MAHVTGTCQKRVSRSSMKSAVILHCVCYRGLSAMCINNFSEAYNYFKTAVQLEPNNTCVSRQLLSLLCICNDLPV